MNIFLSLLLGGLTMGSAPSQYAGLGLQSSSCMEQNSGWGYLYYEGHEVDVYSQLSLPANSSKLLLWCLILINYSEARPWPIIRSYKWLFVLFSRHCPKSCSITSDLCSSTVGAKQKSNLAMKHRHQFLFLCLFCCTFTFMIPFTISRSLCLKDGLKCSLPSLQFILPATWPQHIPRTWGCSALCHGYYYFLHLPKYLSRGSPFFWGKQCPAFPVGSWRPSGASAEISVTNAISPVGWGFIPLLYHYY